MFLFPSWGEWIACPLSRMFRGLNNTLAFCRSFICVCGLNFWCARNAKSQAAFFRQVCPTELTWSYLTSLTDAMKTIRPPPCRRPTWSLLRMHETTGLLFTGAFWWDQAGERAGKSRHPQKGAHKSRSTSLCGSCLDSNHSTRSASRLSH